MEQPQQQHPATMNNSLKVFVGGLGPQTTTEGLKAFFSQFGAVKECDVKMAIDFMTGLQRSRGFGFVTFENEQTVDDVVSQAPMIIDEKKCDVKRIEEGRDTKQDIESRKIFVGGLPEACDTDMLRNYFASIDPQIESAKVMIDAQTGKSRRFGFVVFSNKEHVNTAVARREQHYIEGKWIDVHASGGKDGQNNKGGKNPKGGKKGGFGKGGGKGGFGKGQPYQAHMAYDPYGAAAAYGAQPAYGAYGAVPQYGAAAQQYYVPQAQPQYAQYAYAADGSVQYAAAAMDPSYAAAYQAQYAQAQPAVARPAGY